MSIVERIQELHYITDDDGGCCQECMDMWPCVESRAAELLQRAVELLKRYAPGDWYEGWHQWEDGCHNECLYCEVHSKCLHEDGCTDECWETAVDHEHCSGTCRYPAARALIEEIEGEWK